ncbi:MAG: radical SAM protein [Candidatus Nitrosoabyssus spongiisocia]|nr:MAG: radical SAM protein [Nitrosopumilaceae archaeon AB1(1)]
MQLNYDYPLYRPPSEANSLIFQVTIGCSFNECSFCDMYRFKEYSERTWDEIKTEIDLMAKQLPDTRRIFLADGDAINLDTAYLISIIQYLKKSFPNMERISCYAMPMNLLKKTSQELRQLYDAGLEMLYLGVESGSDIILRKVTKGAIPQTIIRACLKAKDAGFTLSCMVILGLGGKTYTKQHIAGTADVISKSSPDYVGALTLYLENGIHDEFLKKFDEPFTPISDEEALDELEQLVTLIDSPKPIIFRANHGSNAFMVKGTLPADKSQMLKQISWMKQHPDTARPSGLRGF